MSFNIQDLDKVDDNNQQNWPEGTQKVNEVNNAGRADEGMLARWFADYNGSKTTTGTASALVVDLDTAPTAYYNGLTIVARVHVNVAANATLNAGGLGAATIKKNGGQDLKEGDLVSQTVGVFVSDGTNWTLTSVAIPNIGTEVGDLIVLEDVDGNAGLPAVDGSQLTNLSIPSVPASNRVIGLEASQSTSTTYTISKGSAYAWDADAQDFVDDLMTLSANLSKDVSAAWVEGSGNGSLDSQTTWAANSIYSVYLIKNPTSDNVDVLVSSNHVKPNALPTNYTRYRQVAALRSSGSTTLQPMRQIGSSIRWLHNPLSQFEYDGSGSGSKQTLTVLGLPYSTVDFFAQCAGTGSGQFTVDAVGAATGTGSAKASTLRISNGSTGGNRNRVELDANRQCQWWTNGTSFSFASIGMEMWTRENPR